MLFNSGVFLFAFLPITLVGFALVSRHSRRFAIAWLCATSFFFYGYWNPPYALVLLGSIVANYCIGRVVISHTADPEGDRAAHRWAALGVVANLLLLGYYKYANFFVDNVNAVAGSGWQLSDVLLPIGISFYTFTQIAYLVDCRRGLVGSYGPLDYALFVVFFPQLIAGPILHHREIVPQFAAPGALRLDVSNIAIGTTVFAIGLFKKMVLADGIAVHATPVFAAADAGGSLDLVSAWGGALAYTFQLYFDFSGYSDMAIGLSRLFGIVLPLNFASPYKALNIQEFWRRWHMTLSRFLRDYVYIPLGGGRAGTSRRSVNLMLTMLIGGFWHGAGWNFVIWGGLHGVYLVAHRGWSKVRPEALGRSRSYRTASWALTFALVVLAWVFFRATSLDGALAFMSALVGLEGVGLPGAVLARTGSLGAVLSDWGVVASGTGGAVFVATWSWILVCLCVAVLAPNTQQIVSIIEPDPAHADGANPIVRWRPNVYWGVATGVMLSIGVLSLSRVSEFLYFQF